MRRSRGSRRIARGDYLPSGKFVAVMAVPGPSTIVMAFAGLAVGGGTTRRRRKRA